MVALTVGLRLANRPGKVRRIVMGAINMRTWMLRNAEVIEAASAALTAVVAVVALVGVIWQVRATSDIQAQQSARDAYRNHLALAVTVPNLAEPDDTCALMAGDQAAAYDAFVSHLLYAAEQMLDQSPDWESTFRQDLEPHLDYICTYQDELLTDGVLNRLLADIAATQCPAMPPCG